MSLTLSKTTDKYQNPRLNSHSSWIKIRVAGHRPRRPAGRRCPISLSFPLHSVARRGQRRHWGRFPGVEHRSPNPEGHFRRSFGENRHYLPDFPFQSLDTFRRALLTFTLSSALPGIDHRSAAFCLSPTGQLAQHSLLHGMRSPRQFPHLFRSISHSRM